jgi:hypothetical protein
VFYVFKREWRLALCIACADICATGLALVETCLESQRARSVTERARCAMPVPLDYILYSVSRKFRVSRAEI